MIFFGLLPDVPHAGGFTDAMRDSMWFEVGLYLLCAALMVLLPKRARAH